MTTAIKVVNKLDKANKLVSRSMHENGPRSYKRGQGALLAALSQNDGATQRDLTVALGVNRKALKDIVKKAKRNGYVTIENVDQPKTYAVKLTAEGAKVAEKREKANAKAAEAALSGLTEEETETLFALCDKLVVSCKENGISAKKLGRKPHRHGRRCHKRH
ncbi:MAG: MarR family winged helix-turn-helix transcriptional regulator [Coriobacteriia bacterium]|nr:MarR family winged helix-turn-helix transcriptional regulator [Coriobacteriia bacterium]